MSRHPVKGDIERALAYHERSKHHLPQRFAPSLGYLDWNNQPNPFRLYEGAERVVLERAEPEGGPPLDRIYDPSRIEARPFNAASVSQLLYDSMALSAWKKHGSSRWSLRCNPSSGNLHPTEAYLIAGPIVGLSSEAAVWHYTPLLHALEHRAPLLDGGALAALGGGLLLALSSVHWREAWKYGERAYRYCQHDVGHAIAAVGYAAGALGWHVRMLPAVDDDACAGLLGIAASRGPDAEHPDVMLVISAEPTPDVANLEQPAPGEFSGEPNTLSDDHHPWLAIDEVAAACRRSGSMVVEARRTVDAAEPPEREVAAREMFRSRRSAVGFDGETAMDRETFFRMLSRLMPRKGQLPFAALWGVPRIHLLLFVHRVTGLEPGLYLLLRDEERIGALREQLSVRGRPSAERDDFIWERVDSGKLQLPLFALERGDARSVARTLACHQDIASDGAFAAAMLAELSPALATHGAWFYRHLFWEAGAIGQVLYLEAEAAGVRGTGIGCFFDDGVHQLLGIEDQRLQSLYHFTVGGPVDDGRLQTLAAYHHLE